MPSLPPKALHEINIPEPRPDKHYHVNILGQDFAFSGLKLLLNAASFSKSGDQGLGNEVNHELRREAALQIISNLTLQHFYDRPLTDDRGDIDDVMRVNYDIDLAVFEEVAAITVGELKDWMQTAGGAELKRIGRGLTGVMVSAVTKLMGVHDMIYNARKIHCTSQARTNLGLGGTLSTRIQPNHPTDDLDAITALVWLGLSMGNGDQLIGLNPSDDSVDNIATCLLHLDKIRRETGAPTQVCVLSHIRTQLACLNEGAPVEILFQSLAGTEAALREAFDVTVSYLDEAWHTMKQKGALRNRNAQFMYFETGQGANSVTTDIPVLT